MVQAGTWEVAPHIEPRRLMACSCLVCGWQFRWQRDSPRLTPNKLTTNTIQRLITFGTWAKSEARLARRAEGGAHRRVSMGGVSHWRPIVRQAACMSGSSGTSPASACRISRPVHAALRGAWASMGFRNFHQLPSRSRSPTRRSRGRLMARTASPCSVHPRADA